MSLVTVSEILETLETDLPDSALQAILDREEAEIVRRFGSHYTTGLLVTEDVVGTPARGSIFLERPIASITSVTESADNFVTTTVLTSADYIVDKPGGVLQRWSGTESSWAKFVRVVYTPQDETAERRSSLIELVRIAVGRQVAGREMIGDEYEYWEPKEGFERQRDRVYARIHHFINQ
jgi:hypothetical protein